MYRWLMERFAARGVEPEDRPLLRRFLFPAFLTRGLHHVWINLIYGVLAATLGGLVFGFLGGVLSRVFGVSLVFSPGFWAALIAFWVVYGAAMYSSYFQLHTVNYALGTFQGDRTGEVFIDGPNLRPAFFGGAIVVSYQEQRIGFTVHAEDQHGSTLYLEFDAHYVPDRQLLLGTYVEQSPEVITNGFETTLSSEIGDATSQGNAEEVYGAKRAATLQYVRSLTFLEHPVTERPLELVNLELVDSIDPDFLETVGEETVVKPARRIDYHYEYFTPISQLLKGIENPDLRGKYEAAFGAHSAVEAAHGFKLKRLNLKNVRLEESVERALNRKKELEAEGRAVRGLVQTKQELARTLMVPEEEDGLGLTGREAIAAIDVSYRQGTRNVISVEGRGGVGVLANLDLEKPQDAPKEKRSKDDKKKGGK